jgi:DNA-binding winged helix-turn-helix (wHTH) protein
MEALILLVQRAGTLVERSDIAAAVWGAGVFVEHEAAINTAVRKIRQCSATTRRHRGSLRRSSARGTDSSPM